MSCPSACPTPTPVPMFFTGVPGSQGVTGPSGPQGIQGQALVRAYKRSESQPDAPVGQTYPGWFLSAGAAGGTEAGRLWFSEAYFQAGTIQSTWTEPQLAAEGISTYFTATPPVGPTVGDTWFDSSDNNRIYRWDGSSWVDVQKVLELADFGLGIRPVLRVDALDFSGEDGDVALLSTDNKLYRWTGSAWTAAVPTLDLTGQITQTQITDGAITTPKLAAGAVEADKIAANSITSDKIVANSITAGKIQAGAITAAAVGTNLIIASAANIGDAVITDAKIANLAAGKITAGSLAVDVLLEAASIKAGTVSVALNLEASYYGTASRIYNPTYPSKKFKTYSRQVLPGGAQTINFGTGTSYGFTECAPLMMYGPGHASAVEANTINIGASGELLVQLIGRVRDETYTGVMTMYCRVDGGSPIALGSVVTSDAQFVPVNRSEAEITGATPTSAIAFYVAPCDSNGDIPAPTSPTPLTVELDVLSYNF